MSPSGIRRSDIVDTEVVDQIELGSDGTVNLFTGVVVVSTTSGTKRVVVSGVNLINGAVDERLEANDKVTLAGTSGGLGDGTFTVASIVDDTTFVVVEAIGTSTGGTATAKYPPGAKKVGLDPTGFAYTIKTNVQDALKDIDAAIAVGGITEAQHKVLRQLIHFISDGPAEGFASGAYKEVTGTVFPTAIVWWESSAKLKKIVERLVTWTGAKATQDQWKVYASDGVTVLATVTDAVTYSGIYETSRTRTIA